MIKLVGNAKLVIRLDKQPKRIVTAADKPFEAGEALENRLVKNGKAVYVLAATAENVQPKADEPKQESIVDGVAFDDIDFDAMSRTELNKFAADIGIEHPEKLPTKTAVKAAIAAEFEG